MAGNIGERNSPGPETRLTDLSKVVVEVALDMRQRFSDMNTQIVGVLRQYEQPRSEQYITQAGRDDAVEWKHEQLVFQPKYKMPLRNDIIEMKLRFPMEGDKEPDTYLHPRDVFVELMYSNGVFMRYLVNYDGLQHYRGAGDIALKEDVDLTELESQSIFTVPMAPPDTPELLTEKLETTALIQELLVAYRAVPHTNSPTIDAA